MPWKVEQDDRCTASKPWGVVNQQNGNVEGCHATKDDALKQAAALYVNVKETKSMARPLIPLHHTPTTNEPWDHAAAATRAAGHDDAFAWAEENGGRAMLAHHHLTDDGALGPANVRACSAGIARLNGARPALLVPAGDRRDVWDHLAAHLLDAGEAPDLLLDWQPPAEERVWHLEDIEIRDADPQAGKPARIVGHAAVFNKWSDDLGGFRERVGSGAFTKTLQEADVRATFNHDANYVLGRQRPGQENATLELRETSHGLRTIAYPPETIWAHDLMVSMRRGDIDQMSFTFKALQERWSDKPNGAGLYERDVAEARLYDVAVVTFPAYPSTDASVRSALVRAGIPFDMLAGALDRAARGAAPTPTEVEMLSGTIEVLKAYIPAAPPVPAHHGAPAAQAGRSVAHLRRLLALAEVE